MILPQAFENCPYCQIALPKDNEYLAANGWICRTCPECGRSYRVKKHYLPFKMGDVVKLTKRGLEWSALTPADLVAKGHKNKFHVTKVKDYPKHRDSYPQGVISLAECCGKKGCTTHPAEYFSLYRKTQ